MKFKTIGAALMALVMTVGMFPTVAFAYSNEDVSAVVAEKKDTEAETEVEEELPYSYSVSENGDIIFSFNGEEYTYEADKEPTGEVVTGGSRLNVRTGAGMDYKVIDQLCPGEEVSVIGTEGDWYKITVPAKTGYVHSDYLKVLEDATNETDAALLKMFMLMFMDGLNGMSGSKALTPDGNMSLIDDYGSATGEGKQFITLTTKNGNIFYMIIDRDDKGSETVHFLNLVDEADLLSLMEEEQVEEYMNGKVVEEPEESTTETEPVKQEEPEEKPNMMPAIVLLFVVIVGGGVFAYMKIKEKKEQEEANKPDPDADYVDDDEDYGYEETDEEYSEDEDEEIIDDDEENDII